MIALDILIVFGVLFIIWQVIKLVKWWNQI